MSHNLDDTVALLTRTPAAFDALLRGLPEAWTLRNEGDDTFSVFDVIGHLIHGERTDWIPRTKMIREFGESRTFERFDRWAHVRESEGKSLGTLLDEFALLRSENLRTLRDLNLGDEELARSGRHPVRRGDTVATAGHVGRARLDASSPDFEDHGASVPRRRRSLDRIPRRHAVPWT